MKSSPVVHFEMPAEDNARVAKFYETVFGWKMVETGPEMGNYLIAQTAETDTNNMVTTPGTINGGFFKKGGHGNIPHVVIAVSDINAQMELVKANGGKVEGEVMDIPGIGKFVMIVDTEDNKVGVLQPSR